jgi:hypothetical protein
VRAALGPRLKRSVTGQGFANLISVEWTRFLSADLCLTKWRRKRASSRSCRSSCKTPPTGWSRDLSPLQPGALGGRDCARTLGRASRGLIQEHETGSRLLRLRASNTALVPDLCNWAKGIAKTAWCLGPPPVGQKRPAPRNTAHGVAGHQDWTVIRSGRRPPASCAAFSSISAHV